MPSAVSPEQIEKITKVLTLAATHPDLRATLRDTLNAAGLSIYTQLNSSPLPPGKDPERQAAALVGIYLDTETSGLDVAKDGVTQLAMIRFWYDERGIVAIDDETFMAYQDPGVPIAPEVTAITGITQEMVEGQKIDADAIRAYCAGAGIVFAHKAGFDRPFVEKCFPDAGFDGMPWFCSLNDVDWAARGFAGKNLEILLLKLGYVYRAHDAEADVRAGATLLATEVGSPVAAITEALEAGSRERVRIVALDSAYEAKDRLKARGYKFDGDLTETGHKAWWVEIANTPEAIAEERAFLLTIYGPRSQKILPTFTVTPANRFTNRLRSNPGKLMLQEPLVVPTPARATPLDRDLEPSFL